MLSDFQEKKKPFLALKKPWEFLKVQKIAFFLKGLTHALGQKMPIFPLIRFGQNETRYNS